MIRNETAEKIRQLLSMPPVADNSARVKKTFVFSAHIADLIDRLTLLQGTTQVATVQAAIEMLANSYGEDVVFPSIE